jgi:membrane protease YdiL (CAAX protease family)
VEQLLLRWRGGFLPWLRGAGYSLALRVAVGMAVVAGIAVYALFRPVNEATLQQMRPKVEVLVEPEAMVNSPLYLWLNLTVVSFVMAGLREELWRAGMLAAMRALWPGRFASVWGGVGASAIIAVAFGLGHAPQGWGAVGMTALLGFGLGAIMVVHRSIWDAVLAHGFFNATSFALLYLVARFQPGLLGGG